jgi:hypothetical protein
VKRNAVFGLFMMAALSTPMAYANPWWVDVGAGVAGLGDSHDFGVLPGFSGAVDVNYMLSKHQLITARATDISGLIFIADFNMQDAGLMYGLIQKWKYGYVSASAGVAYTHTSLGLSLFGSNSVAGESMVGIPLEINAGITPFQHLGFGVKLFANVNKQFIGYGALAEISVGHLSF